MQERSTAGAGTDGGHDGLAGARGRDPALADVARRYWDGALAADPLSATLLGVHDHDARLPDLTVEADDARRRELGGLRVELERVDRARVGPADRVTASLLDHQIDAELATIDLRLAEMRCDQMLGPHAELLMVAAQLGYPAAADAEAAIERARAVPAMLEGALGRVVEGLSAGRTPAAAVLARSLNTLDAYLASPVEADPLLAASLDAEVTDVDAWADRMRPVVAEVVRPAMAAYRDGLRDRLGPHARDDAHAGWCWLPDGDEMYAAMIREHTTTDVPPQDLHDLGRQLCEQRLPQEFAAIGPDALGTSDPAEIFERLREDPALRHRDAAEVLDTATASVRRATAAMSGWFGLLPSSPCVVQPIPEVLAQDAPYAYYFPPAPDGSRPGTYFINTADPSGSSATEAESIAFHEAIPGHHLQLAIAQDLDDLPEFQRHGGATSYIEGWGLYAERLADEMGLYSGPLDRIGMLTADAWRSARLVVDTGLHALGWSRQDAIDYFTDHTPVPLDQIATEVDRYLAMPGQALAYKVGQLEIERLRASATADLGDRFDVAGFHDVVLGSGAVTLPVLGDLVAAWVSSGGRGAPR